MLDDIIGQKRGLRHFINPAGMNAWAESERRTKSGKKGRRKAMGYADFPNKFEEQVKMLLRGREGANRKLTIGVICPASDLARGTKLAQLAEQVGDYVARAGAVLMLCMQEDHNSISEAAERGAVNAGGMALPSHSINDGVFPFTCDAFISINSGGVRIEEIILAATANRAAKIPMVILCSTNGEQLKDIYAERGKRVDAEIMVVYTAEQAVLKAIELNCWKWMDWSGLEH